MSPRLDDVHFGNASIVRRKRHQLEVIFPTVLRIDLPFVGDDAGDVLGVDAVSVEVGERQ